MKLENIKIILCDIDGTLLNSEKKVTPKTIEAIKKVREKGILFGLATGRTLAGVKKLIVTWGIKDCCDVLMGFNGGIYEDYSLNKADSHHLLDGPTIAKILDEYSKFDMNPGIFDGDKYYVLKDDEYAHQIAKNNTLEMVVDDLSKYKVEGANKILGMAKPEVINEMEEYYASHPGDGFRCVRSQKFLYEFLDPDLSKTKGIEIIANNHNLTLENVCVFGDELNDFEMIRDCGVGVCMGNGNPKVKEIANYVTASNDEDGIAKFIEEYLL